MPRRARLDAPGTLHHVIIRGIEKRRIVDDRWDRQDFVSRMGQVASDTETVIYAWALMTNHAHILLRSSEHGLSRFMRRFLTGYAIRYNLRHKRHGHLFQNRYKSIVCDEDAYFRELVRYIHLNPVRARVVKNMSELDRHHWSGHGVLMGKIKHEWQDRDYVLSWFGEKKGEARKTYRRFVKGGMDQGRRPELVGGGLIRSRGGWSVVKALRRLGVLEKGDERILGSGEFVEKTIAQADETVKYQLPSAELGRRADRLIEKVCRDEGVEPEALRAGSRRRRISGVRSLLAEKLVRQYGLSLAETARQLGVTTSAVANSIRRRQNPA